MTESSVKADNWLFYILGFFSIPPKIRKIILLCTLTLLFNDNCDDE